MKGLSWLLLAPVCFTVIGLLTGADWLVRPTPGWTALPLGNLATWGSFMCLGLFTLGRRPVGWRRILALVALVLAVAWGPVSRMVTGNWAFSASGTSSPLPPTVALAAVTALVLLVALLAALGPGANRGTTAK